MEDWFTTWFNSPYYHILYKDRDYSEAELFIDALVKHVSVPSGSKVLDLACGKGRHSVQLNKHGFDVIGIDLAEESIAEAQLNERERLEFYVHDMRSLYWSDYFDLVVNLFTSFGYFHNADDDQRTITSVADSLKPNGLFVIDFMNAVKVINNLVSYEEKTIEGVQFVINRKIENGVIEKHIQITDKEIKLEFTEEVDALKLEDFKMYIERAGLELLEVFGNYKLGAFDETSSDRLILIAKKPQKWS